MVTPRRWHEEAQRILERERGGGRVSTPPENPQGSGEDAGSTPAHSTTWDNPLCLECGGSIYNHNQYCERVIHSSDNPCKCKEYDC